jgi:enamine deaminase RidA (YjgF/YER057c/UK114 family)
VRQTSVAAPVTEETVLSQRTPDTREYLKPHGVAEPTQPYTHVVRAGNTLYLSGQVPIDANGEVVGAGDPTRQAEQCWRNIELCLAAAGATLADIVKVVCFFSDIRHVPYEIEVRRRLFPDGRYPAVSLMEAAKVGSTKDNILMEIDVIAVLP